MIALFVKRYILEATVFICGAVVMIYEINGTRILSPFIGTSTYVWTSLIGVILGALSLGYWLGGKWADRRPDLKILAFVIFIAGGFVSITILLKELVLSFAASAPIGLELKSVLAALILFAPASIALGFVSPYAVKLKTTTLEDTGKVVGRLYALSTVGSIVGTFTAGFFLIPFVGSIRTLYLVAGTLIVLSMLLAPFALTRFNFSVVAIFVLGIAGSEFNRAYALRASGLHDIDTEYSRVQVFDTIDPRSGKPMRALATDPYFIQSAMFPDSDEPALEYGKYYHLIRHFKPDFRHSLIIGGAGYSFPKEYLKKYSNACIDVVEIDPGMTRIAREHFRLVDSERLSIIHQDARVFLAGAETGKYDAILMDAFGSMFSVPYQLTTLEAVIHFSRVLKDDGVVIFNLGSAITGDASGFLQAEFKTYQQVFPQVHLFKVNTSYADERLQNLIIVAAQSASPIRFSSDDPALAELLAHRYSEHFTLDNPVLTDDLAPVEYYNSIAQNIYLANR
ncbi:MAG: fused MFS/spermidine synthase [Pyrinomonadaceae bacterium]